MLSYVQQFKVTFVKKELKKADEQHRVLVDRVRVDIVMLKWRDEDLDTLFKWIYKDMLSSRLTTERFNKLAADY